MRQGFSLLELSIVLVIIGLLAGGVMTGQALIRASELRAVVTEYQKFRTALQAFRDKYQAVPGDMKNATLFWGKDNTNCTSQAGTAATPGTCSGNGDGLIPWGATEQHRFWQHLALAGMIEGTYTGVQGPTWIAQQIPGTNSPTSKLPNAGWGNWSMGPTAGDPATYAGDYGGLFVIGAVTPDAPPYYPALTPAESWGIDKKMDDGLPARGIVVARFWNNACAAADDGTSAMDDLAASYRLTDSSVQCALFFVRGY